MTEINKKNLKRRIKENKLLTKYEQKYLIDNMEKLEKIEQMIDECRAWTDDMAECLIEIEQIVKEV